MKILLQNTPAVIDEDIPSQEEILLVQLEMLEATIGLDDACHRYDELVSTQNNINEVITVIKTHGIDDGLVTLLGKELRTVAPSFEQHNADDTVAELVVASESVMSGIGKMLRGIWRFIVRLWHGFVKLVKKIFGRDEKTLFVDVTSTTKELTKEVGSDATVAEVIKEAAVPGSTDIKKKSDDKDDVSDPKDTTTSDGSSKPAPPKNTTPSVDYREDLINKLVDMNITKVEADMDQVGINVGILSIINAVIDELSTGTWGDSKEDMTDNKGAATLGLAGTLHRLEDYANKMPSSEPISKQEIIERFVKPVINLSTVDAVKDLKVQNEVLLTAISKSVAIAKAIGKIKIEDIKIVNEDPKMPLIKVLRLVSAISSMYTTKIVKQKQIIQKQLIAINAACKIILNR